MATRTGSAVWEGTLKQGRGTMKLGSGPLEGPYSFSSRFEEGEGDQSGRTHWRRRGRLLLNGALGKSGKGRLSSETNQHDRDGEIGNGRWRTKDHDDRS